MKRTITIAAALLALQIVVAVALFFGDKGKDISTPDTGFLGFAADAVTALEISGPEKEQIILQKSGSGWIIAGAPAAPASVAQVTALLDRLAALKQGFAVATSAGAAKRFKVADDVFQRHVVLKAGDKVVGDLYVGTSPGFRQIHARQAGAGGIFAVELSTFELETGVDQWLDKNLFKIKEDDMTAIAFADFSLEKKEDGWQLAGLQEGQLTDAKAAGDLVAKASGLIIQAVLKPQEAEPLFAKAPVLHFTITRKDGGAAEFRLVKAEGDYYILKHSERDLYCKVHSLQVESLLKVGRDSLIAGAQPVEPEQAAAEVPEKEKTGK